MNAVAREISGGTDTKRADGMPVGRPFRAGRSGNPHGRPRGLASAAREVLRPLVAEGEEPALALARFYAAVLNDDGARLDHRMQAAQWLADRGWGRVPQFAPIEEADPLGLAEQDLDAAVLEFNAEVRRLAAAQDVSVPAEGGDPLLASRDGRSGYRRR